MTDVAPQEVDEAITQIIIQGEIAQRHIDAADRIGLLYAIRRLTSYARFLDGWATDQAPTKQEHPKQDDFDDIFR